MPGQIPHKTAASAPNKRNLDRSKHDSQKEQKQRAKKSTGPASKSTANGQTEKPQSMHTENSKKTDKQNVCDKQTNVHVRRSHRKKTKPEYLKDYLS